MTPEHITRAAFLLDVRLALLNESDEACTTSIQQSCSPRDKIDLQWTLTDGGGLDTERIATIDAALAQIAIKAMLTAVNAELEVLGVVLTGDAGMTEILVHPPMRPVQSSNLAAIGFKNGELYVRFHGGAMWKYAPVASQVHLDLVMSHSPGSYFAKHVKNNPNIVATKLTAEVP